MTEYLSTKIKLFSFISILMVIFIHTYYIEGMAYPTVRFLQNFVGNGLCRVAVPFFFAISGYLFYYNIDYRDNSIILKIRKRIKTLVLPYIFWNILFELFFFVLYIIPQAQKFVNSNIIERLRDQSLWDSFVMIFWEPAGFHLWFLRDLILIVALTPLLYFFLKRIPLIFVLFSFLICFILEYNFLKSIAWFLLGAFWNFITIKKNLYDNKYIIFISLILFLYYLVICVLIGLEISVSHNFRFTALISGVISIWLIFDFLPPKALLFKVINYCSAYSFFIYCFHEPTLNIFKKLPVFFLSGSSILYITSYLLVPFIMSGFAIVLGSLLKNKFSPIYNILTGGR